MDIFLEQEIEKIKVVNENKGYWFIRTYGGEAFEYYVRDGYVGLGFNEVPYQYILDAHSGGKEAFTTLRKYLENNTDYKKGEATKWANQLVSFNHDVNVGDTVIIPSRGSWRFAIGTVTSDVYLVKDPQVIQTRTGPKHLPEKRRRVKWQRIASREEFQSDLKGMLSTHQGITNAKEYAEVIEGAVSSLFAIEERTYLIIQIAQDEDINAFAFRRFLDGLTYFYTEFATENGHPALEDLSIKIKVQSKGTTLLKGFAIAGIVGLAGVLALSNNVEVEADLKNLKVKGKSDGFLKSISDFLDRNQQRRIEYEKFQDSVRSLKAGRKRETLLSQDVTDSIKSDGKQEDSSGNGQEAKHSGQ